MSRIRQRQMGPTPRFGVDDTAGNFTILEYLGWSSVPPVGEPRKLIQEHHWYRVRCTCGKKETHTQQALIDKRRHRKCTTCIDNDRRKEIGNSSE